KIHYFSQDGNFIRSVPNAYFTHRPSLFLDENRFLTAPMLMMPGQKSEANIKIYNLETKEDKVVTGFSVFKGGTASKGGMRIALVVGGLTPMMTLGYHNNRLYFGMNDKYTINVSDISGKAVTRFSLDRDAKEVSLADKRQQFADDGGRTPKDMLEKIIRQLPDTETYFDAIQVHNGLVYVFLSDLNRENIQKMDIFSMDGKYLYRSQLKVEDGYTIDSSPVIKNGYLYLGLQDEEGEPSLNKYKIQLPTT
ncbi:MAG: hypothetical protein GY940_05590, partial [bacterium]|nr:hypothetical protein [bacterium]